jgi:hypothetical protein
MKMIDFVVLISFSIIFFQCKSGNEEVANNDIKIKGEMDLGSSRLDLGDHGKIEWCREDEIYMMSSGADNTIAVFSVSEISDDNSVASIECRYKSEMSPDIMYRDLYYLGNWRYCDDTKITFSIYEQSGFKSDIGKHFVASAKDVMFKAVDKEVYTFPLTPMNSMVSVACFDLSLLDVKDATIEYANGYNAINLDYNGIVESDYVGDSGYTYDKTEILESYESGPIWVRNLTDKTYVVLLPQKKPLPNTMVYFKNNGKVVASVNFPKGISPNKMYLSHDGGPIVVNPDGMKSDIEAVEYIFCLE